MGSRVVRSHTLGEKIMRVILKILKTNNLLRNLDWHWRVPCLRNGMEWHSVARVPCSRGINTIILSHKYEYLPFSKSEENFASIDYAVYRAGQLGLKLIVPLTGRDMNQLIFSKKNQWHFCMSWA